MADIHIVKDEESAFKVDLVEGEPKATESTFIIHAVTPGEKMLLEVMEQHSDIKKAVLQLVRQVLEWAPEIKKI